MIHRVATLCAAVLVTAITACSNPALLFDLTKNRLEGRNDKYPEVVGEAILPLDSKAFFFDI